MEAEALKLKLEQAQRERRQLNEESGQIHRPVWFTRHSDSTERAAGSSLSSSSSTVSLLSKLNPWPDEKTSKLE